MVVPALDKDIHNLRHRGPNLRHGTHNPRHGSPNLRHGTNNPRHGSPNPRHRVHKPGQTPKYTGQRGQTPGHISKIDYRPRSGLLSGMPYRENETEDRLACRATKIRVSLISSNVLLSSDRKIKDHYRQIRENYA